MKDNPKLTVQGHSRIFLFTLFGRGAVGISWKHDPNLLELEYQAITDAVREHVHTSILRRSVRITSRDLRRSTTAHRCQRPEMLWRLSHANGISLGVCSVGLSWYVGAGPCDHAQNRDRWRGSGKTAALRTANPL